MYRRPFVPLAPLAKRDKLDTGKCLCQSSNPRNVPQPRPIHSIRRPIADDGSSGSSRGFHAKIVPMHPRGEFYESSQRMYDAPEGFYESLPSSNRGFAKSLSDVMVIMRGGITGLFWRRVLDHWRNSTSS